MARLVGYVGPMCSGKTSRLTTELMSYAASKLRVLLIRCQRDTREVFVHSGNQVSLQGVDTVWVARLAEAEDAAGFAAYDVIGIDEGHFYPDFAETLTRWHLGTERIYLFAALDLDYMRVPFAGVATMLAHASKVKKLRAFCECGAPTQHTRKLVARDERIEAGGTELYYPACRSCWRAPAVQEPPADI